ncbi:MAG: hypothetical protein ABL921_31635, partial [Pirellula sp.]
RTHQNRLQNKLAHETDLESYGMLFSDEPRQAEPARRWVARQSPATRSFAICIAIGIYAIYIATHTTAQDGVEAAAKLPAADFAEQKSPQLRSPTRWLAL